MTAKKPAAAPALTISMPKPRGRDKGEPPQSAADSASVGNNTTTPAEGKLVDLGFKVPAEYRKDFRLFCATHDLSQVDALKAAMADYMQKKGWNPSN